MRIRSKRIGRPPTMLMIGQRVGKLTVVEQKGNTARGEWRAGSSLSLSIS